MHSFLERELIKKYCENSNFKYENNHGYYNTFDYGIT